MNLGSMEQRTEGMKRQAQELIEQAYQRGYNAGYEEGQKKHEEDEEIHVGDEVAFNRPGGTKFIVVSLSSNGKTFDALSAYGAEILLDKSLVTKTGRTFPEVAEFMKKLKEKK